FKGAGGNGNGGNGYGFFGDSIKLQGKVTLPKDVILRYTVPTTGDGLQYLMTETYDTYDSATNTWTNTQTQANNYKTGDVEPLSPGVDEANYKTDTYAIVFSYVQGGHLFSPGSEPVTFSVPAVASVSSAAGVPVAWNANAPISAGTTYYSQGYISTATEDQLRAVPYPNSLSGTERAQLYQTDLLNEYLPNTPIPQDVAQKALDATKGTTNMYDAAVHLTDYLRVFTYSLDNPNPPQGQDAISWFLNYRQGFCTYFASAMAIMGRSLGMPTRIVAGFAHGTYDSASHKWIVRGTDSHVWTQIYFGKYGWINFEPTSSFDSFARAIPGTGNGTPTPTVNGGGGGTQASPVPTHSKFDEGGGATGPLGTTGASSTLVSVGLLISLLIIFALLCLFLFATWWRLIYRGLSPITAAFARVTRLGAWAGAPPGRSQTPDEYAEQLGRILPGQRRALQRLSDIYARERWGGGLRDDDNAAVPTLYDEVRTSVTPIILRRLRHLPAALLERARRLTRGRATNHTNHTNHDDW
ncbi:MAG TPA: transglutaminase domain-containing protein, partial [Ktedonobacterales bacterium]|nr:transglutaminase domain-containing protein [Ktedonobacterales bacterium]